MIIVEGYKAFRGVMKITPKNEKFLPFLVDSEWLYKPDTDCWYGNGRSYVSSICEIVKDDGRE
jgi:hypothetical protein